MNEVQNTLARDKLGVGGIVFLVLAAVAPVTVLVVVIPLAIALGNGGGVPIAILLVALALLLFAVGYAQITKELTNAGGFYAIAVRGLGRIAGLITGLIATIGYNAFVAGALGTIGFFSGMVVLPELFGFELDWFLSGVILFVIVFLLARSGIAVSAVVLAIALILEIILVFGFAIAVMVQTGLDPAIFTPEIITGGSLWIGLLLAATAFIGFEATALFGEEAKEPRKTIPRATYAAIIIIGLMHAFAAQLAFHNSAGRYIFALGRARVLPSWLAKTNANGAPERALLLNLIFAIVVAAIFRFTFPDLPSILTLVPVGLGFATLSIMIVQTIAALSVVAHFRKNKDPRLWSTLIAPGLGFLALLVFSIMALVNFSTVAGSEEPYVLVLPWLLLIAIVGGIIHGLYLKSKRPDIYARLSDDLEQFDEELADAQRESHAPAELRP